MKYLFFLTILFCIAATAAAQLPPVRSSDPAGVKSDAAGADLLRKADNASFTATARTAVGAAAVQLPVRTTDNVTSSPASASRTADNTNASKLPMRTSEGQTTAANAVVVQQVPLRTADPGTKTNDAARQKADTAIGKPMFFSERPAGDTTRTGMQ